MLNFAQASKPAAGEQHGCGNLRPGKARNSATQGQQPKRRKSAAGEQHGCGNLRPGKARTSSIIHQIASHRDDRARTTTPMTTPPCVRASRDEPGCDDADPDPADSDHININDGDVTGNGAVADDDDEGVTAHRPQGNPTTLVVATMGGPGGWSQAEKSRSRAQGIVPGPPDGLYPGAGALFARQLRGGSVTRFGELKGEKFRARHISRSTFPVAWLGVDGDAFRWQHQRSSLSSQRTVNRAAGSTSSSALQRHRPSARPPTSSSGKVVNRSLANVNLPSNKRMLRSILHT